MAGSLGLNGGGAAAAVPPPLDEEEAIISHDLQTYVPPTCSIHLGTCVICMSNDVVARAPISCGHIVYCDSCLIRLYYTSGICGVCREPIDGLLDLYF